MLRACLEERVVCVSAVERGRGEEGGKGGKGRGASETDYVCQPLFQGRDFRAANTRRAAQPQRKLSVVGHFSPYHSPFVPPPLSRRESFPVQTAERSYLR